MRDDRVWLFARLVVCHRQGTRCWRNDAALRTMRRQVGERQAAPAQAREGSCAASWYRPPSHCRCWARLSQPCLNRSLLLSAAALALGHPGARLHPSASRQRGGSWGHAAASRHGCPTCDPWTESGRTGPTFEAANVSTANNQKVRCNRTVHCSRFTTPFARTCGKGGSRAARRPVALGRSSRPADCLFASPSMHRRAEGPVQGGPGPMGPLVLT